MGVTEGRRQRVIDTTMVNHHHDDGDLSMRPHLVDIVTMVTNRRDVNQRSSRRQHTDDASPASRRRDDRHPST
jgi:hypothetical protein